MLDDSAYPEKQMLEDRDYILKKLDITIEEWDQLMAAPNKTEDDYRNNKHLMEKMLEIKKRIGK